MTDSPWKSNEELPALKDAIDTDLLQEAAEIQEKVFNVLFDWDTYTCIVALGAIVGNLALLVTKNETDALEIVEHINGHAKAILKLGKKD